jgi:hypothetical protein
VFDLAAELAAESSILSPVSGAETGSPENQSAIDSATLDEPGGDLQDDPPREHDAGSPRRPVEDANNTEFQHPAAFDQAGDIDADLGDV